MIEGTASDVERRGRATAMSPGLTALDRDRQASMASEGGRSGAAMERQTQSPRLEPRPSHRTRWALAVGGLMLIAGIGVARLPWARLRRGIMLRLALKYFR